jgi:hypothetical protein
MFEGPKARVEDEARNNLGPTRPAVGIGNVH